MLFIRLAIYLTLLSTYHWIKETHYRLRLLAHQLASLHEQVARTPTLPEGVLLIRARMHGKVALDAKLAGIAKEP
jgi:hypothetical protein